MSSPSGCCVHGAKCVVSQPGVSVSYDYYQAAASLEAQHTLGRRESPQTVRQQQTGYHNVS